MKVSGEEMQEVNKFNYLGVMISTDGGMGKEVAHRMLQKHMWHKKNRRRNKFTKKREVRVGTD